MLHEHKMYFIISPARHFACDILFIINISRKEATIVLEACAKLIRNKICFNLMNCFCAFTIYITNNYLRYRWEHTNSKTCIKVQ